MAANPFQDLFSQNVVRTPDGRYFLPFSKTMLGQRRNKSAAEMGITDPATIAEQFSGDYHPYSYSNAGTGETQNFDSLEDYFNALDVGQGSSVGNDQNVIGINTRGMSAEQAAAMRGKYNGELGYYVDPSKIVGVNPAHVGGKPNESGLWQALSLVAPAVGGIFGGLGAGGSVGSSAFEGNVPAAVGTAGSTTGSTIGSTISGSEGAPTVTGSAASDTLAGSDPYGSGVDYSGNPTGQYASGAGSVGNSSLWGSVLGAGIGAAANIYSANKAANVQTEAGKESNATQLAMFNQARSDLEPWRTAGEGALGQLTKGIQPGGDLVRRFTMADFENDPVTQASFRYGLDEGTKGVNRMFGAKGMSKSGAAIKALDRFTTDYVGSKAGDSYNRFVGDQSNVYNRLAGVAGTGQTSAAQTANLGVTTGANIGNTLEGIANARGAASIATGNAVSNAAANIGNAYQTQSYLEALRKRQPTTNNYYYTMGM